MKKKILAICLSCNLLNAGMPDRELDDIEDYRRYLEERRNFYWDMKDSLILDNELLWVPAYNEYIGRIDAYNDALFWLAMIGRPIPRN